MPKSSSATSILCIISVLAIGAMLFQGPISQDPAYHLFADSREMAGVDNFWNVLSNLPFLAIGLYGLWRFPRLSIPETKAGYLALCVGVLLVSLGSAYYHLAPANPSLIWDRLPMTVAFMALFSLLLDERKVLGAGRHTLWPLLLVGIASAVYWYWTESHGAGDLRPYLLVQFLPLLLIPAILLLFRGSYLSNGFLLISLGLYVIAKVLELFDLQVFDATGLVSGHTLKHLVAGLAVLCIVVAVPASPRA